MKPKQEFQISLPKIFKSRLITIMIFAMTLLAIFTCYISNKEISIFDSSSSLTSLEVKDPDATTYLDEEFMKFEVTSAPDAQYKEVTFKGVTGNFSRTKYTTLAIPETIVNKQDGVTYHVTRVDIPYPRTEIGNNTVFVTNTNPDFMNNATGYSEDGTVPVATEAFKKTSAFLSQNFKAIILPKSIKEVTKGSLWGFASLEYMKVPFIGTRRITKTDMQNPELLDEKVGILGSMFGGPHRKQELNYQRYTTYDKTGTGYDPNSNMLSITQGWIKNVASTEGKQLDYVPSTLKKLIITGEAYTPETGVGDHQTMEMIPVRAVFENPTLETIIIGTKDSKGENNLKRIGKIGMSAFSNCKKLNKVEFNVDEVGNLEKLILSTNQNLQTVVMPKTLAEIPEGFFSNCTKLSDIKINTVDRIGTGAFFRCETLPGDFFKRIPNGITEIGDAAFKGCTSLTEVDLSGYTNLQTIGKGAFYGCYGITRMVLPFIGKDKNSDTSLNPGSDEKDYIERKKANLFNWIFCDAAIGSIEGENGFQIDENDVNFYTAKQYWGSEDVHSTEWLSAFIPARLTEIRIDKETQLEKGVLQGLKNVKILNINSSSISTIAPNVLKGCESLEELIIPTVGSYRYEPTEHRHIGRLFGTADENMVGTGKDKYYITGSGSDRSYVVPISLKTLRLTNQSVIYTENIQNLNIITLDISANTTSIENEILYNCSYIENLTLPFIGSYKGGYDGTSYHSGYYWWAYYEITNSLQWIFGDTVVTTNANLYDKSTLFYGYGYSQYVRYIPVSLKTVRITNETVYSTYAFRDFKNLTRIELDYVSGQRFNEGALNGCSKLEELVVPFIGRDENIQQSSYNSDSYYTLGYMFGTSSYSNTYTAYEFGSYYQVPKSLTIVTVKQKNGYIGKGAFKNFSSLTTVNLNFTNKIVQIPEEAFYNCVNLSNFNFGVNYAPEKIGNYAFYNCLALNDLNTVIVDNVTTELGAYSFAQTSIQGVDLSKFRIVGDYAFSGCNQIVTVDVPAGLEYIGSGLFANCAYLENVKLGINTARPYMFENCTSLKKLDLTGVTTVIPEGFVKGCVNLTDFTQDPETTAIGPHAFNGCSSLPNFKLSDKTQSIGAYAFAGCTNFTTMIIPNSVTSIDHDVYTGCSKNPIFTLYVYKQEKDWPSGWVENWNCNFPVYIIGYNDEDIYEYAEIKNPTGDFIGWKIIGVKQGYQLGELVQLPRRHLGVNIIAIGERALSDQTNIKEIIIPETYEKIGDGAFLNSTNNNKIKVWSYKLESELENGTYSDRETSPKNEDFMKGLIFYRDKWTLSGTTPKYLVSGLFFEFGGVPMYDGTAKTRTIKDIRTQGKIVGSGIDEHFDSTAFNFSYYNNINACDENTPNGDRAQIYITPKDDRFVGDTTYYFNIKKKALTVVLGTHITKPDGYQVNYEYTGLNWTFSEWNQSNILGLPDDVKVSGTLMTDSPNCRAIPYMENNGLRWSNGFTIVSKVTGKKLTNNFTLDISKILVVITKATVRIEWPNEDIVVEDGINYHIHKYNGESLNIVPKVYNTRTNELMTHLQEDDFSYQNSRNEYTPGTKGVVTVTVGDATQATSVKKNNLIVENKDQLNYYYKIANGEVKIIINNYKYKIDPRELYWSFNSWSSLPSYVTMTGLGPNSVLTGELRTIDDKAELHSFKDNTIVWGVEPMITGRNGINETTYYDLDLQEVSVTILHNKFSLRYEMVGQGENPTREPIDFVKNNDGTLKVNDRGRYYMEYEADGDPHAFNVIVNNQGLENNNLVIGYSYGTGETVNVPKYWTNISSDGVGYLVAYQVTADRFITEDMPKKNMDNPNAAFEIIFKKSKVKVNPEFRSEYTGKPFDPNPFILKKGKDQNITFTYYSYNDKALVKPLPEAPINVGKYFIKLDIPETDFFLPITDQGTNVFTVEITPRVLNITLDPTDPRTYKVYDGKSPWELEINNTFIQEVCPNGLLPGDTIYGNLKSNSLNAGSYSGLGSGIFFGNLSLKNANGEDRLSCYEIRVNFTAVIKPREFHYVETPVEVDWDNQPHRINVEISDSEYPDILLTPGKDYKIIYEHSSGWTTQPFMAFEAGTYKINFRVSAPNYKTYEGVATLIIRKLNITYELVNENDVKVEKEKPEDLYYTYLVGDYDNSPHYVVAKNYNPIFSQVLYGFGGLYEYGYNFTTPNCSFGEDPIYITEPGQYIVWVYLSYPNYNDVYIPVLMYISADNTINTDIVKKVTVTGSKGRFDTGHPDVEYSVNVSLPVGEEQDYSVYYSQNLPEYKYLLDVSNPTEVSGVEYGAYDITDWTKDIKQVTYTKEGTYKVFVKVVRNNGYKPYITAVDVIIYPEDQGGGNGGGDGGDGGVVPPGPTPPIDPDVPLKKIEGVTFTGTEVIYDGKEHTITINNLDKYYKLYGEKVKVFSTRRNDLTNVSDESLWSEGLLTFVNSGKYQLHIMIKIPGYEPFFGSTDVNGKPIEVIIEKRDPNVRLVTTTVEYCKEPIPDSAIICDEDMHDGARRVSFYNLDQTGTGKGSRLPVNPTELGRYYVEVEYLATQNCLGKKVGGIIEIIKRTITMDIQGEMEYDGAIHWPIIKFDTHTTDTFKYEIYSIDGPLTTLTYPDGTNSRVPIEIGDYKIGVRIIGKTDYYVLEKDVVDFKITNRKINIELELDVPFDGNRPVKVTYDKLKEALTREQIDAIESKLLANIYTIGVGGELVPVPTNDEIDLNSYVQTKSGQEGQYLYITGQDILNNLIVNFSVVNDKGQKRDYYEFVLNLTINIVQPELDLIIDGYEGFYDGEEHGPTIKLNSNVTGIRYYFALSETSEDLHSRPFKFTDVGEHTVYYVVTSPGFADKRGSYVINIKKTDLDINLSEQTKTYDGEYLDAVFTINNITRNTKVVIDQAKKYYFNKNDVTLEQLNALFADFTASNPNYKLFEKYNIQNNAIKDAGEYYLVIYYQDSLNWNKTFKIGTEVIEKRILDVTFEPTLNPGIPTDGKGNFVFTFDYNGQYRFIGINGKTTIATGNLVPGQSLDTNPNVQMLNSIRPNSPDAGVYSGLDFEFDPIGIVDQKGNQVGKNYKPNVKNLKVVIKKIPLPEDLFNADAEQSKEYTGNSIFPDVFKPEGSGNLKVVSILKYDTAANKPYGQQLTSAVNVGTYEFKVTLEEGKNYLASTKTLTIILTITRANINITWENTEKEYDGLYTPPVAHAVDKFGKEIQVVVKFETETSGILAGEYLATAVFKDLTLYDNYVLNNEELFYKITPKKYEYKLKEEKEYDGTPWKKNLTTSSFAGFLPDHQMEGYIVTKSENPDTYMYGVLIEGSKNQSNLGAYSFIWTPNITVNPKDAEGNYLTDAEGRKLVLDASQCFDIDFDLLVKIVGGKIQYECEKEQIFKYNGGMHRFQLTVKFPTNNVTISYKWKKSEEDESKFVTSTTAPEFKEIGSYDVRYSIAGHQFAGDVVEGEAVVRVVKGDPVFEIVNDLNRQYDGLPAYQFNNLKFIDNMRFNDTGNIADIEFKVYYLGDKREGTGILIPESEYQNQNMVGYYRIVVTCKKDQVTPEDNRYEDLHYEKIFQILPKELTVAIKQNITISKFTPEPDKNILQEGDKHSITGNINLGNNVIAQNFTATYELTINKLQRGKYAISKQINGLSETLDNGMVFNWKLTNSKDGQADNVGASQNFIVKLNVNIVVSYKKMNVVQPTDLEVVWEKDNQGYFNPIVVNEPIDAKITYSSDGSTFTDQVVKVKEPGVVVVYYRVEREDYEPFSGNYTITVKKRDRVDIAFDQDVVTKEYDDLVTAGADILNVQDPHYQDYLFDDQWSDADIVWEYRAFITDNKVDPEFLIGEKIDDPKDVGKYIIVAIIPESPHYNSLEIGSVFEITPKKITVLVKGEKVYDSNYWLSRENISGVNTITVTGNLPNHEFKGSFYTNGANAKKYYASDFRWENPNNNYTITAVDGLNTRDVTKNYRVSFDNNSVVEILKANIKFTFENYVGKYDGALHGITVEVASPSKYKILYSETKNGNFTETEIKKSNPGIHKIYFKIVSEEPSGVKNYNDTAVQEATISIEKSKLTIIEVSDLSKVFDGAAVFFPTVKLDMEDNNTKDYVYEYFDSRHQSIVRGTETELNENNKRPRDAGVYYVSVTIPASGIHLGGTKEVMFTISKRPTKVVWSSTVFEYNGNRQIPEATITRAEEDLDEIVFNYNIKPLVGGDSKSIDPGKYQVNINADQLKNYAVDGGDFTYEITKCKVVISVKGNYKFTGNPYEFTYDPTGQAIQQNQQVFTVSNLPENHLFEGVLKTNSGLPGNYIVNSRADSSKFLEKYLWEGSNPEKPRIIINNIDVTDRCFDIEYDLKVIIDNGNFNVQVQEVLKQPYTGQSYSISVSTTAQNIEIRYSEKEAGPYKLTTPPAYTHVKVDSLGNVIPYITYYQIISTISGKEIARGSGVVEIIKAKSIFQLERPMEDMEYNGLSPIKPKFRYDGMNDPKQVREPKVQIWQADENGLFDTNKPSMRWEEMRNVGRYRIVFTLPGSSNYYNDYEDETAKVEFEIIPRKIIVRLPDQTKNFDSKPWNKEISNANVENLIGNHIFRGTLSTIKFEAGTYVNPDEFYWINGDWQVMSGDADLTKNYSITTSVKVEILPAEFDCTFTDYIGDYDGKLHQISYEIRNPKSGYTLEFGTSRDSYGPDQIMRAIGTTTVYYRLSAPNFRTIEGQKLIDIRPLDGDISNVNFPSKVYDGTPVPAPTFITVSTGAVKVTYYVSGDTEQANPLPGAPTNAGQYFGVITIESNGVHAEITARGAFTISKREIDVIWGKDVSFIYDGLEHAPSASAVGVAGEDVPVIVKDKRILAGTGYVATAETEHENYTLVNNTCTFEITKRVIDVPKFPPEQKFETGDEIKIKDEDGNEYVVDDTGKVTEIIHPDGTIDKNPDLDFGIVITPPDENGQGGRFDIVPNDKDNTKVPDGNSGGTITIIPKPIKDPNKELEIVYTYTNIYTGFEIHPLKAVYYIKTPAEGEKLTRTAEKVLLVEGKDYKVNYLGNVIDPTDNAQFELIADETLPSRRYDFKVTCTFKIVMEKPKLLELKADSISEFVTMVENYDDNTRSFDVAERTEANQKDMYLGHLFQGQYLTVYLNMFANDVNDIKIYNAEGIEIAQDDTSEIYVGTGWSFALVDEFGTEIDRVYCLLFGDANGDGQVNNIDRDFMENHFNGNATLDGLYNYAMCFIGGYFPSNLEVEKLIDHFAGNSIINEEYKPIK